MPSCSDSRNFVISPSYEDVGNYIRTSGGKIRIFIQKETCSSEERSKVSTGNWMHLTVKVVKAIQPYENSVVRFLNAQNISALP